jgi:hypothetical protein
MAALEAAIQSIATGSRYVALDGRVKPGHDVRWKQVRETPRDPLPWRCGKIQRG